MNGKTTRLSSRCLVACLLAGSLPAQLMGQTAEGVRFRPAVSEVVFPAAGVVLKSASDLAAAGRGEEGLILLDSEIRRSGEIPSLVLKAVEIEATAGKFDAALARVAEAQRSAPRPEPWIARSAELLEQANRIEEARSVWLSLQTRMEKLSGTERELPGNRDLADRVEKALAMVGKNDRRNVWLHPEDLYEEEIAFMNKNISARPSDASLWHERSLFFLGNGHIEQALLDCDETDRLAPGKFPTNYVRSQILFRNGEAEKARTVLDELLLQFPDHREGRIARGRILVANRKSAAALDDFRVALQSSGHRADLGLIDEITDLLIESSKRDEALKILIDRIAIEGNQPPLLERAMAMEVAAGDFNAALARVDAMLKNTSQPEHWMAKRAQLLGEAGRTGEARAAWQALLTHIAGIPNLQRGQPAMIQLAKLAKQALAENPDR